MTAEDRRWAREVKQRDSGRCIVCGDRRVEAAHIVPRSYTPLRHHLDNGVTLCHACHRRAHREPWFLRHVVHLLNVDQRNRLCIAAREWKGRASLFAEL
jgi:hypothetical protein